MLKNILLVGLFLITNVSFAGTYIMTKHEFKSKDSNYNKTPNQIRFGYDKKIDNWELYGEIGGGESLPNAKSLGSGTSLLSYEFGAKKKISDNFFFKIKWEGEDYTNSTFDHKIEIKTIYRF